MPFQKGDRVGLIKLGWEPGDTGTVTGTYSINVPEMQYDVRWDCDGSTSERITESNLILIGRPEPELHLYLYASPHPLMLTPDDTDMTDLLMANARLFRRFKETAYQSVEVMRAMGEVCRLTKEKLGVFIDLMGEDE